MFDKSCAQEIRKECWLVSCGWVTLFTCADYLLKKLSNYSMNKDNGFEKVENVFIIVIIKSSQINTITRNSANEYKLFILFLIEA